MVRRSARSSGMARRAYDGGVVDAADELDDQARLDLANVVASARLEGHEISGEGLALAVEYLAGRIDADTYGRRVREAALGLHQPASG